MAAEVVGAQCIMVRHVFETLFSLPPPPLFIIIIELQLVSPYFQAHQDGPIQAGEGDTRGPVSSHQTLWTGYVVPERHDRSGRGQVLQVVLLNSIRPKSAQSRPQNSLNTHSRENVIRKIIPELVSASVNQSQRPKYWEAPAFWFLPIRSPWTKPHKMWNFQVVGDHFWFWKVVHRLLSFWECCLLCLIEVHKSDRTSIKDCSKSLREPTVKNGPHTACT